MVITMAKLDNGILNHLYGKVGRVIGSTWNGINYIRSVPARVKNPNTPAQQAHRMRFRLIAELLTLMKPVIKIGFASGEGGKTPVNRAMSYNLPNAVTGEFPDLEIDFPRFKISRGSLLNVYSASVSADVPGEVRISWEDNSGYGSAQSDDKAIVMIFNKDKHVPVSIIGQHVRSDEEAIFTLPEFFEGDGFEAYLAFTDAEGERVSDSFYAGFVVNGEPAEGEPDPEGGEGDD